MQQFTVGDRVRVDIPDEMDPDHEYHGSHGKVVETLKDEVSELTGRDADATIFRVALESGPQVDFRRVDLRSPIEPAEE